MNTHDFLVELGTEELPSKALETMATAFAESIFNKLGECGLSFDSSETFATPRRLAVLIKGLIAQAPSKTVINEGPPKTVALDENGKFTKAAEAFANKNNISVDQLQFGQTAKGEKLLYEFVQPGVKAEAVIAEIIVSSAHAIPVPKRMRWGASREEFSRPVQWLVMLLDKHIVNCSLFGVQAGNLTRGHRFHSEHPIEIDAPSHYEALMRDSGQIIVNYDQRRDMIKSQVLSLAAAVGGEAIIDSDLLNEVCGLVEYPVALIGQFEERFLRVPKEALISSMVEHQKYFPVVDANQQLMPHFIFISNIDSDDPQQVVEGNERVIRPRLSDAAFFYETDLKTPLADRLTALDAVVFQTKLGSIGDKARRISSLAASIAQTIGSDSETAARAGLLAKADLVSELVLEFDDLQGIAGSYYAQHDGEAAAVSDAIKQHYLPKFQGDRLPEEPTAIAVALADRIDTLVGIFGIGLLPTGNKDPFGLRRAALALIRIIRESQLSMLVLTDLISQAVKAYGDKLTNNNTLDDCLTFIGERYRAFYQEQDVDIDCVLAVQALIQDGGNPYDIDLRINAVNSFKRLDAAEFLASANKRVNNILAKNGLGSASGVRDELCLEPAEQALLKAVAANEPKIALLIKQTHYGEALTQLAQLKAPVDDFFETVMVMADDPALQANRLALLARLQAMFTAIADISELQF